MKARLYRQKNAEVCERELNYPAKHLTQDELYLELIKKFEEKALAPPEKFEKHILRGAADVFQLAKDLITFFGVEYAVLLKDIKIFDISKSKLIQNFKALALKIQKIDNPYSDLIEICSCVATLARLQGHSVVSIENKRERVEKEDGSYLGGFMICDPKK